MTAKQVDDEAPRLEGKHAEKPGLALLDKQSTDGDRNQAGRYLAARLPWRQATFAAEDESFASVQWVVRS